MAEFKLKQTAEEVQKAIDDASIPSDWNQTDSSAADFIKNKPFGDMPTGGDTLYWDGNTEGLEILDLGEEGAFYKISDTTPALAEAQQGGILATLDGVYDFTSEDIMAVSDTVYAIISPSYLMVVLENNADLFGFTVPKKGCYSMDTAGISLTIPGYTGFPVTKKMEEKYLPGAVILYADAENYLYATSDTSDTSKRMTKASLIKMIQSGSVFYMLVDGYIYCPATSIIMAPAFGGIVCTIGEEIMQYFTAEYVPEG